MAAGRYSAILGSATGITTAKTLIELTVPTSAAVEILRAWCGFNNATTSAQMTVRILRKSSASSGGSVLSVSPLDGSAAAGTTAQGNPTAEGSDSTVLIHDGFNILQTWYWIPTDMERIVVAPGGRVAIKLAQAPTFSATVTAGFTFREIG